VGLSKRARLIKPMLSYDSAALVFELCVNGWGRLDVWEDYRRRFITPTTIFRRDLYAAITEAGVNVGSRYVAPSAHMTIARPNSPNVFGGDPVDGRGYTGTWKSGSIGSTKSK
jgi:hypothetical protein